MINKIKLLLIITLAVNCFTAKAITPSKSVESLIANAVIIKQVKICGYQVGRILFVPEGSMDTFSTYYSLQKDVNVPVKSFKASTNKWHFNDTWPQVGSEALMIVFKDGGAFLARKLGDYYELKLDEPGEDQWYKPFFFVPKKEAFKPLAPYYDDDFDSSYFVSYGGCLIMASAIIQHGSFDNQDRFRYPYKLDF